MHRSNSQRCQINQEFGGEVNIYSRLKRTTYSSTYMYVIATSEATLKLGGGGKKEKEQWPIVCLSLLKSRK